MRLQKGLISKLMESIVSYLPSFKEECVGAYNGFLTQVVTDINTNKSTLFLRDLYEGDTIAVPFYDGVDFTEYKGRLITVTHIEIGRDLGKVLKQIISTSDRSDTRSIRDVTRRRIDEEIDLRAQNKTLLL